MTEESALYDDLCCAADQMSPNARFELYAELIRGSYLAELLTPSEIRYMAGLTSSRLAGRGDECI